MHKISEAVHLSASAFAAPAIIHSDGHPFYVCDGHSDSGHAFIWVFVLLDMRMSEWCEQCINYKQLIQSAECDVFRSLRWCGAHMPSTHCRCSDDELRDFSVIINLCVDVAVTTAVATAADFVCSRNSQPLEIKNFTMEFLRRNRNSFSGCLILR